MWMDETKPNGTRSTRFIRVSWAQTRWAFLCVPNLRDAPKTRTPDSSSSWWHSSPHNPKRPHRRMPGAQSLCRYLRRQWNTHSLSQTPSAAGCRKIHGFDRTHSHPSIASSPRTIVCAWYVCQWPPFRGKSCWAHTTLSPIFVAHATWTRIEKRQGRPRFFAISSNSRCRRKYHGKRTCTRHDSRLKIEENGNCVRNHYLYVNSYNPWSKCRIILDAPVTRATQIGWFGASMRSKFAIAMPSPYETM